MPLNPFRYLFENTNPATNCDIVRLRKRHQAETGIIGRYAEGKKAVDISAPAKILTQNSMSVSKEPDK